MNLPDGYSMERYASHDQGRITSAIRQWVAFAESCLRTQNVPVSHAEVLCPDLLSDFASPELFDGRVENPIRRATCDDPRFRLSLIRRDAASGPRAESIEVRLSEFDSRYPEVSAFIVAAAGRLAS